MHQSREAGKWRWFPTSYRARLTLACSFIRSLVSLILVSVLLGQGINHVPFSMRQERIPQDDQVVCYSILLVAGPFSSILLWDALVHKNTIQVVAITGFDWFFLMYTSLLLMYTQKSWSRYWMDHPVQEARTILLILLPILALSCILLSLGARSIYREFGWTVFKQLGADRSVRRMYKTYLKMITLIKIDIFFFVIYSVQQAVLGRVSASDMGVWIQVAVAIPLAILVLFMGLYSVEYEHRVGMSLFIMGCFACLGYLIYQIYRTFRPPSSHGQALTFLLLTLLINLILVMVTIACSWMSLRTFGQGLREHVVRNKVRNQRRNSMLRVPRWDQKPSGSGGGNAIDTGYSPRWVIE